MRRHWNISCPLAFDVAIGQLDTTVTEYDSLLIFFFFFFNFKKLLGSLYYFLIIKFYKILQFYIGLNLFSSVILGTQYCIGQSF